MFGFFRNRFRKPKGEDAKYFELVNSAFGIRPRNIELYKLALLHRSASLYMDDGTPVNNERLEFLGDAVIEAIVSDYLFIEHPKMDEGLMTRVRSRIVSRNSLNELCQSMGLDQHIIVNGNGSLMKKHLYGNALEAMIGAIYLDRGYECAHRVMIECVLRKHLNLGAVTETDTDYKSRLIEWCQRSKHTIRFQTGFAERSTAQKPMFRSIAIIDEMELGYGMGASKKEAEQNAAYSVSLALTDSAGDSVLDLIDRIDYSNAEAS